MQQPVLVGLCAVFVMMAATTSATIACADSGVATQLTEVEGVVTDVQYVGKDRKKVFVLTDQHILWRSGNEGQDWSNVMESLSGSTEKQDFFGSGVAKVVASAANRDHVFIQGVGKHHWVTRDGGKSFETAGSDKVLTDIMLHPTNPNLLLASAFSAKCYGEAPEDEPYCNRQLWFSEDFGKTFTKKADFVNGYQWGKGAESVVYGQFAKATNHQPLIPLRDSQLMYTRNLWKTEHTAKEHVIGFKVINHHVYAATQEEDGTLILHESRDDGVTMGKLLFPEPIPQRRYVIFEDGSGGVVVCVMHGDDWGNAYVSNGDTHEMVLVLRDVPMGFTAHVEWVGVDKGAVVIANVLERGVNGEGGNSQRSVISFDRGAHWKPLVPPADMKCTSKDCSLHVHTTHKQIMSQHTEDPAAIQLGVVLSKPHSAGLILAVGNAGEALEKNADAAKTLLSRDGGLSWQVIASGSHVFDMGDHGGVIAMAKSYRATTHLHYSTQENGEYHSCSFTNSSPVDINDIVTEPNGTSTRFIMYGRRNGAPGSVLVYFDFQQLMATPCKGLDKAGEEDSDFELWTPSDGTSPTCRNGETVTYTRRKAGVQCFYGAKYEKKKVMGPCKCTPEDFECNFCYERKKETTQFVQQGEALLNAQAKSVPCVWACSEKPAEPIPPPNCRNTYAAPTAYRKIAGNKCKGGAELHIKRLPCPGSNGDSGRVIAPIPSSDTSDKTDGAKVVIDNDEPKQEKRDAGSVKVSLESDSTQTAAPGIVDKTGGNAATPEESSTGAAGGSSAARSIVWVLLGVAVVSIILFFALTNRSSQGGGWRLNLFGRGQYAYASLTNRLDQSDLLDDDDLDDDYNRVGNLENAALQSIGGSRAKGGLDCRVLG